MISQDLAVLSFLSVILLCSYKFDKIINTMRFSAVILFTADIRIVTVMFTVKISFTLQQCNCLS